MINQRREAYLAWGGCRCLCTFFVGGGGVTTVKGFYYSKTYSTDWEGGFW